MCFGLSIEPTIVILYLWRYCWKSDPCCILSPMIICVLLKRHFKYLFLHVFYRVFLSLRLHHFFAHFFVALYPPQIYFTNARSYTVNVIKNNICTIFFTISISIVSVLDRFWKGFENMFSPVFNVCCHFIQALYYNISLQGGAVSQVDVLDQCVSDWVLVFLVSQILKFSWGQCKVPLHSAQKKFITIRTAEVCESSQ